MKKVLFEDLKDEAIYLAKVLGCSSEDIFTEAEIEKAQQQGYIFI